MTGDTDGGVPADRDLWLGAFLRTLTAYGTLLFDLGVIREPLDMLRHMVQEAELERGTGSGDRQLTRETR